MATRNRNIGYTGQPYREDPERDVLWARPEDPPGGNVTTEQQWQDRSTVGEGEIKREADKDDTNKVTPSAPIRTGGSIFKKATDKVGDAIDDSKRAIDRALTNARYEDIAKRMDETYGRNKTRLDEEAKRARRNRLMYGIGDVFNAMHRAYAHSRGIQAMPGSERQMSDKARERYDKIVAQREKLDEDYANFLLKLQNARTMSDRYAALDDWRRGKNKIEKQKADTNTAAQENRANQGQQVTDSVVGRNNAQAGLANAKKEAVERNGTASGNPPSQRSGSKGGSKGSSKNSKPKKETNAEWFSRMAHENPEELAELRNQFGANRGRVRNSDISQMRAYYEYKPSQGAGQNPKPNGGGVAWQHRNAGGSGNTKTPPRGSISTGVKWGSRNK